MTLNTAASLDFLAEQITKMGVTAQRAMKSFDNLSSMCYDVNVHLSPQEAELGDIQLEMEGLTPEAIEAAKKAMKAAILKQTKPGWHGKDATGAAASADAKVESIITEPIPTTGGIQIEGGPSDKDKAKTVAAKQTAVDVMTHDLEHMVKQMAKKKKKKSSWQPSAGPKPKFKKLGMDKAGPDKPFLPYKQEWWRTTSIIGNLTRVPQVTSSLTCKGCGQALIEGQTVITPIVPPGPLHVSCAMHARARALRLLGREELAQDLVKRTLKAAARETRELLWLSKAGVTCVGPSIHASEMHAPGCLCEGARWNRP